MCVKDAYMQIDIFAEYDKIIRKKNLTLQKGRVSCYTKGNLIKLKAILQ